MQLIQSSTRVQALLSFNHVKKVLEAAVTGLTLGHVIQAQCYATKRQDIPIIRAVWQSMMRSKDEDQVSQSSTHLKL